MDMVPGNQQLPDEQASQLDDLFYLGRLRLHLKPVEKGNSVDTRDCDI